MSSTYSTNLAIELIGTGDQAGSWGNTTNTNLGTLIEQAISGYVTQAVSTGTDTTITIPNGATGVARNMYIELTGTGGTNTNLIVPANKKLYFIFNNTSSGQVTVKVSGQTGVSVPNGKKVVLVCNGTDIVNGLNYIADFGTNSFTVTNLTATSATITNLIATSASITTLTNNPTFSAGTANGVLYLNGSKVATSGSALTFDGSSFLVGATSAAAGKMVVKDTASSNTLWLIGRTSDGASSVSFRNAADSAYNARLEGVSNQFLFEVGGSEGMRLTSTGLGIGTSSPGKNLEVAAATDTTIRIRNTTTTLSSAVYGTLDWATSDTSAPGGIVAKIDTFDDFSGAGFGDRAALRFFTNNSTALAERARIDSSGNLLVGGTSQSGTANREAVFSANKFGLAIIDTTAQTTGVGGALNLGGNYRSAGDAQAFVRIEAAKENATDGNYAYAMAFSTTPNGGTFSERGRFTSDGLFQVLYPGNTSFYAQLDASDGNGHVRAPVSNMNLVFDVSGSERGRFTAGGYFKASNDGTYESSTGSYHEARQSASGERVLDVAHTHASNPYGMQVKFTAASPDNNTNWFFVAQDSTTTRCYIWSDGDLANHDGVYGTISDERLKQDIVDASSQWDDLKSIRFRKYRMKTDVEANPDAPAMFGVVAQELAQVCPGLVDEHPNMKTVEVTDEEGNVTQTQEPDGTTTMTVKSSILLMKAAKALQEAMARIESLEAKVAALEAQ